MIQDQPFHQLALFKFILGLVIIMAETYYILAFFWSQDTERSIAANIASGVFLLACVVVRCAMLAKAVMLALIWLLCCNQVDLCVSTPFFFLLRDVVLPQIASLLVRTAFELFDSRTDRVTGGLQTAARMLKWSQRARRRLAETRISSRLESLSWWVIRSRRKAIRSTENIAPPSADADAELSGGGTSFAAVDRPVNTHIQDNLQIEEFDGFDNKFNAPRPPTDLVPSMAHAHAPETKEDTDVSVVSTRSQRDAVETFGSAAEDYVNRKLGRNMGSTQTMVQLWIFFLQKIPILSCMPELWPSWFLKRTLLLSIDIDLSYFGVPPASSSTAPLLLAPALVLRGAYLRAYATDLTDAPAYRSVAECICTGGRGVAVPKAALTIAIAAATSAEWLKGLGILLCWPTIGFMVCVHTCRLHLWKSCSAKYGDGAIKAFWTRAVSGEVRLLIFLYFAVYLVGIGALLDLMTEEGNLLRFCFLSFYSLVAPAFCAFVGFVLVQGAPDEKDKYESWLKERLTESPVFTIVEPFEKKFAWYKAVLLIETAAMGFAATLPPSTSGKLIVSIIFSAAFTSCSLTRPYTDDTEDRVDMASRVFVLITTGVGVVLEMKPGRVGQMICDIILGIVVVSSNAMFMYAIKPSSMFKDLREATWMMRKSAKVAKFDEQKMKNLSTQV